MADSYLPCGELERILRPAYAPCVGFNANGHPCSQFARWDPISGHIPRGFVGALGSLDEVELVLVAAEPGDPHLGERYDVQSDLMEQACRKAFRSYHEGTDLFHRNVRYILDACFPRLTLNDQLRKSWFVDAYLCSARKEGGQVPRNAWLACARDYLRPQLELLKDRLVVALGNKAQSRIAYCGVPFMAAYSVAPPGCNFKQARPSWNLIPKRLNDWRARR
jgi:hypothetical protein